MLNFLSFSPNMVNCQYFSGQNVNSNAVSKLKRDVLSFGWAAIRIYRFARLQFSNHIVDDECIMGI